MSVTHIFVATTIIASAEVNQNYTDCEDGTAMDNVTNDIAMANNTKIYFKNLAGVNDCLIHEDISDNLVLKLGTAGKYTIFKKHDGEVVFQIDTPIGAVYTRKGYAFRVYDVTNAKYLSSIHDGTHGVIETSSGDLYIKTAGNDVMLYDENLSIQRGRVLRLYNPANTAYGYLSVSSGNDFFIIPSANGNSIVLGKMPRRNHSANTYVDSHIQSGWGYIQGNLSRSVLGSVTFPKAYSSDNVRVMLCLIGARASTNGVPSDEGDFTTYATEIDIMAYATTNAGFSFTLNHPDTTTSLIYYGYSWIAIGPI